MRVSKLPCNVCLLSSHFSPYKYYHGPCIIVTSYILCKVSVNTLPVLLQLPVQ